MQLYLFRQDRRVYDAMENGWYSLSIYPGKISDQASDEWKANPGRIPPVAEMEMKKDVQNANAAIMQAFLLLLFLLLL